MIYLIAITFIIVFIAGMIFGANFVVKMYNSDKQKDRDWAIDLLTPKKKHGAI